MTYFEYHKKEFYFHSCLFLSLLSLLISIIFNYSDLLLYWLTRPLTTISKSPYLIITDITELFSLKVYITLTTSLFIAIGLLGYQSWLFLAPGLYKYQNKLIFVLLSTFFAFLGIFLFEIYYYLIPQMWYFFLGFNTIEDPTTFIITFEPKLDNYIHLMFKVIGYIILVLQYPFLLFLLLKINVLQSIHLVKFRKIIYVKLFIISTLIAPPDVWSQGIIFIGLTVGMEGILIYSFFQKL